jgi:hypothetical protein
VISVLVQDVRFRHCDVTFLRLDKKPHRDLGPDLVPDAVLFHLGAAYALADLAFLYRGYHHAVVAQDHAAEQEQEVFVVAGH